MKNPAEAGSLNVFPSFSSDYVADMLVANSVSSPYGAHLLTRRVANANISNIVFREDCAFVLRPLRDLAKPRSIRAVVGPICPAQVAGVVV